jgi:hypothetical protein
MKICPTKVTEHEPILIAKTGPRSITLMEEVEVFGQKIEQFYHSDGGSIPRFAWVIDAPFNDGFLAYLVHDYRYTDIENKGFTRYKADWELFHNLEKCGLNIGRRVLIVLAVRCFGWIFWNRNRKIQ